MNSDIQVLLMIIFSYKVLRTSLVAQWLTLCASNARGGGSILSQETKIPHAPWCGQKIFFLIRKKQKFLLFLIFKHVSSLMIRGKDFIKEKKFIRQLKHLTGEKNGYPFQYSCLENSMDRGAWQTMVHEVTKSWM